MKTCGVRGSAISQKFDTIAQFSAIEDFISFKKKVKIKQKE